MKNIKRYALVSLLTLPLLSGCEFLQGTLGDSQRAKLAEETGNPSYAYKTWYYNGCSNEDMTAVTESELYKQSLKINFGKKVSMTSLNGSITVNYTDSNGNTCTDVTKSVSGKLSSDYTSFYLDMSYVINHFDQNTVTSGTASVDIKLSGFVCAEGEQRGRKLSAFELNKLQVKPLFDSTSFTLSTVGFEQNVTKYKVPLNAEVVLEDDSVTDETGTYEFAISFENGILYLTPKFSEPLDGTAVTLPVSGIVPEGTGVSYTKNLVLTFSRNLISIDGIFDDNYTALTAVYASDPSGDSVTNGYDGATDLTGIYVTNDDDYFYVALTGALTVEWYDGLSIMISKDHSFDAMSAAGTGKDGFAAVTSAGYGRDNLAHGKPDYYLFDRIYSDTLKAYVENAGADPVEAIEVSSNVISSGITGGTFIEYAIPMADLANAGIVSGDTVYVLGAFSAHWDEGSFLSDAVPDAAVTAGAGTTTVTINFKKALEFELN